MSEKRKIKKVYAHGAIHPLMKDGEWLYFGASGGDMDYPVLFQMKDVPNLIEYLQGLVRKKEASKQRTKRLSREGGE